MNQVLKLLGWLSILGGIIRAVIAGNSDDPVLAALDNYYDGSFRWNVAITWLVSGISAGVIFLAINRALELLETIAINTAASRETIVHAGDTKGSYPETGRVTKSTLESLSKSHTFKNTD